MYKESFIFYMSLTHRHIQTDKPGLIDLASDSGQENTVAVKIISPLAEFVFLPVFLFF